MKRKTKFRIAVFLTGCLFALALCEIAARIVGFSSLVTYETLPGVGFRMTPNQDARFLKIHVTTNSEGFRDAPLTKGAQNIYIAGDSVVYGGLYIPQDKTFCALLNLAAGKNTDIINAGCNAYAPADMCRVLEQFTSDHPIKSAVFHLLPGGFHRKAAPKYLPGTSTFPDAQAHLAIGSFLNVARFNLSAHYPKPFRWLRAKENSEIDENWMPPGVDKQTWASLSEFDKNILTLETTIKRLEFAGVRVLLVITPVMADLEGGQTPTKDFVQIKNRAQQIGFPTLDLTAAIEAAGYKSCYFDGVHYNLHGHEVVAKAIEGFLIEHHLINNQDGYGI